MFVIETQKLFGRTVRNGKIGLMEKEFFYSEGGYYSKKDGSLIEEHLLLEHDQKRLQQVKLEIPLTFKPFEKEILEKERKALKELALIHKHFPEEDYALLRSHVYYVLNSARACKEGFLYANGAYNKKDFRIEFYKSDSHVGIKLLPKTLSTAEYKEGLDPEYAQSFDFIDFSALSPAKQQDKQQ